MRKNPVFQRDTLGAAILQVRSGRATSRTSLAKVLGISPSTMGLYADQLIAQGFMDESGLNQGPMGRPRRILTTRAEAGWFAGVEFHAQRVQAVGVDFSGQRVASVTRAFTSEVTSSIVIKVILACVAELASSMQGPLLSVGVGAPGLVDTEAGIGIHYAFIPDWNQIPLSESIRKKLRVPVIVQNNLRAIALAERWFGMGHGLSNYVILGPRSGFGMAVVQHGRLVDGAHHAPGEVGRWPWPPGGRAGQQQDLHHALSATATWRRLAGLPADATLPVDLRSALAVMVDLKGGVWDDICRDFALVLSFSQLLLDTEVFILHGPLTVLGERFCECIVDAATTMTPALTRETFRLVPSSLGDDAGALGAASLAMESWLPD